MRLNNSEDNRRKYFQKRISTLRVIGCWPLFGLKKSKFEFLYTIGSITLLTNILVSLFLILIATIDLASTRGKFDAEVCEQIILFIISFQILSKMALMAYKARHLQKLTDDLGTYMEPRFVLKGPDRDVLNKCKQYDLKLSRFFLTLSLLLFVSSMTRPLAVTLRRMHSAASNGTAELVIGELPSKYPFKLYAKSFWYSFCYLQQVLSVLCGALSSWAADSMFCSFLYYLCGHLDILIYNIKNDDEDDDNSIYYDNNRDSRYQNLGKRLVDQHCYLIRYARELNQAFAPLIIIQLLLGAITIGLQLLQFFVIESEGFFVYAKPMVYLSLKLVQLYISSWHGQLLLDKSVEVSEACYFSLWYNKPTSWSLDLKMIMIRSQRPLKVDIAGLFQFSAGKFGGILNTAYSYFTMLRTMK